MSSGEGPLPKINIYLPDDLAEAVKQAGVPVSAICQRALELAVRRVTAIREAVVGELDVAGQLTQLTARAQEVLTLGIARAREEAAPAVGTAHLLAGTLAVSGNLALRVLRALEIDPERIGRELARNLATEVPVGADDALRLSGAAANALELAATEATALGHNYLGCEHLLLGMIAEPEGVAGQVLRSCGADLRTVRPAVAAALAGLAHNRSPVPSPQSDITALVAQAVGAQLQPLVARLERLEKRAAQ
jgi:ATP-dependent Clp protease ATP-binding subunit ClpC